MRIHTATWRSISLKLALGFAIGTGVPAFAAEKTPALFSAAPTPSAAVTGSSPTALRSRSAAAKLSLIDALPEDGSSTIQLNLFADAAFTARFTHLDTVSTPSRGWGGTIIEDPLGTFTLVRNDSGMLGVVRVPGKGTYEIRAGSDGAAVIQEIDTSHLHCAGTGSDSNASSPAAAESSLPMPTLSTAEKGGQSPGLLSSTSNGIYGCDDGTVIDLMVVYSTAAKNAVGGAATMNNYINLAVMDANNAFTNSNIATSLHLVYTYETSYGGNNLFNDLNFLMNPSDGIMDDVPPLHDQYGADIVSLWGDLYGGAGIGYYPDPSLQGINASGINGMDWRGYNGLLLAHEVGHNLWCRHDHAHTAQADTPPHDYSHGYTRTDNAWQDIMAQTPSVPQITYYANPNVIYPGTPSGPTGVPIGQTDPADLYTTIMDTRHIIANFRAATVAGLPSTLYVKASAPAGGNGLSWATAINDLQLALCKAAGSNGAVQRVWVASGTYKPDRGSGAREATFFLQNNLALYGGFVGTETQISQRNPGANVTILSGDIGTAGVATDNCYHVVRALNTNSTSRLDGFQITAGQSDSNYPHDSGGGLRCDNASPTIANCTFLASAAHTAGGVYDVGTSSPLYINCRFLGNNAISYGGGGMENDGCSPTLVNCFFSGNHCNWYGAGMANYASGSQNTKLINCTFSRNVANIYGGIALDTAGPTLTNTILWGNTSFSTTEDQQITRFGSVAVNMNYCIVQGWTGAMGGTGNNGSNPVFIDDDGADNTAGTTDDNPRLGNGSPGIDTGSNAALLADTADLNANGNVAEVTPLDLDLHPRVLNNTVDRGPYEFIPTIPGDFDHDGDVDNDDFNHFKTCATRSGIAQTNGACADAKLDGDTDVDMNDFGIFQKCYSGAGKPGRTNCAN